LAYDQDKIFLKAKEQIEKHNLFFIEDIVAFLPCSKTTFYDFFPLDSNEMDTLKGMLEENKIVTKSSIRAKLHKSDKAAELIALYKLICSEHERDALSMQRVDVQSGGNPVSISPIMWTDGSVKD
jgi:hypothetical protein